MSRHPLFSHRVWPAFLKPDFGKDRIHRIREGSAVSALAPGVRKSGGPGVEPKRCQVAMASSFPCNQAIVVGGGLGGALKGPKGPKGRSW